MAKTKNCGRFRTDDTTMMMYDTEKEVEPFPVENHKLVAESLLSKALNKLANAFISASKKYPL